MDNFANYKNLPLEVQAVLDKHSGDDETYATCQELQDELEQIGWTCEWGLDAVPYGLRKIKTFSEKHSVKCNNCGFTGFEEDLRPIEDMRACPNCETDNYLTDI